MPRLAVRPIPSLLLLAAATSALASDNAAVVLPPPYQTPAANNRPEVIGWKEDEKPTAPAGFSVAPFAANFESPRWIKVLPNGDILVAQSDRRQITLFRDTDHNGKPELQETFVANLNRPFGMELIGDTLYIANTDGVFAYPY